MPSSPRSLRCPNRPTGVWECSSSASRKLGSDALDLLRRCYIEKQKIKDIAAELGRSLTGTYQALSRIRRELFDCMQDRLHREESP